MSTILKILVGLAIILAAIVIYRRITVIRGGYVYVLHGKEERDKFRQELEDEYAG